MQNSNRPTVAYEDSKAHKTVKKSLGTLIEKNLIERKGNPISSAISDKIKAQATILKEKFDPLNIISSIPVVGNYAAHRYGEATGRSSADMHYFTGYGDSNDSGNKKNIKSTRAKPTGAIPLKSGGRIIGNLDTASYTSMTEGNDRKFRRGDGLAELLARQLNLMKKYHNEEIKHIKDMRIEELKRRKEADTWEKNLLKAVLGGGGSGGRGGGETPPEAGTDPLTAALTAVAGAATGYVGKKIRDYFKAKKAAKLAAEEKKQTAKKMVEKEQSKKSAQKLRQEMSDKEFANKRNQELKSQGKLNREQRRAQVRKEIKQRNVAKKALSSAKKIVPETRTAIQPPKSSSVVEGAEKSLGKFAAKRAAKYLAEDVPIIGAIIATGFAANRAYNGDWTGAAMELGLAAAATLALLSAETATPLIMAGQITLTTRDFERQLEENKKINDKWQKDADAAKLLGEPIPPKPTTVFDLISDDVSKIGTSKRGFKSNQVSAPIPQPNPPKPTTVFDLISDDVSKIGTSKRGYKSNQVSAPIPQPNPITQNVTKAIETNRKSKAEEKNAPVKVNVIDKSKTMNNVSSAPDDLNFTTNFTVRNDEDTFAWVSGSNCRRV